MMVTDSKSYAGLGLLVWIVAVAQAQTVLASSVDSLSSSSSQPHSELRGGVQRKEQATVGNIKGLRWIDADMNQPVKIEGSFEWTQTVDIPYYPPLINKFYVPADLNLTMEAIIEGGPVGSVQFFYDDVPLMENWAPFVLCANTGADYLRCNNNLKQGVKKITAQAFSGKSGTGTASPIFQTYFEFLTLNAPFGGIDFYNADTNRPIDDPYSYGPGIIFNVTETPNVAFYVQMYPYKFEWTPSSAFISYDNGAKTQVEANKPYVLPGNNGADIFGFTPEVGNHTVQATVWSRPNLKGQSVTYGPFLFTVIS